MTDLPAIIERLQAQIHKPGVDPKDWEKVEPNLLLIAEFVLNHCQEHGLPFVVSSIIRGRLSVSVSDTHLRRAFDLSVKGWQKEDWEFLVKKTNDHFHIGAVSKHDNQEREAVFEDRVLDVKGNLTKERHIHFQVRRQS